MVLYRLNRTHPAQRLKWDMNRMFSDVFQGRFGGFVPDRSGGNPFPALNVWEDDQALYAEAEMPGLSMNDIEVFVHGDELTVKGERKSNDDESVTYHCRERGFGTFSRVLRIPVEVNPENIEANLRDGVLTIKLPKVEAVQPRKITVKAS